MLIRRLMFASFAPLMVAMPLAAQQVYTADDYARAERWMNYNVSSLVQHTLGGVSYLKDGRVFYRDPAAGTTTYKIADPATGSVADAFDHAKLAAALSTATKRTVDAGRLGVTSYEPEPNGGFIVSLRGGKYHCDAAITKCVAEPAPPPPAAPKPAADANANGVKSVTITPAVRPAGRGRGLVDVSPDKKLEVFIRDWNLWVRTIATGEERQLTTDGVKDYGYATDNAGWTHSDAPIVLWSADSKKIATFQQDQRKTGFMYLVPVSITHPEMEQWRYPLVGDKDVTMIERVVLDVDSGKMVRLKLPPDQHRSTLCDDVSCRGGSGWDDVAFSPDAKKLAFVSTSRDHKDEWLREADTTTGDVRDVFSFHMDTYYESGQDKVNWKYLPGSNEFIWYSEKETNYGQLYLYDLTTGKLKNAITHGDGPVTQLLHVDEKNRVVYFLACGKEKGEDPYFVNYYRADFDGKNQTLLTPEVADHAITPAPDGKTFVDVYSTVQTPQVVVLKSNTGKVLATLGKQDDTALLAAGWKPPTPITVKARDGKTDLYGFMWKPLKMDAAKKYPIIDYVYPGPQIGSCGSRGFSASEHDNQALAELGFIVVCIDGMGTPFRSKSFHDFYSSAAMIADDTIPDQVAGIKELAAKNAWIDANRVGIWGHSGGGNATAQAMFTFPDFFKVGIAESGNHDNRVYEDDWDEKWAGLEKPLPDGTSNYEAQAAQNVAKNLKGHLLLAHGTMDDNVPPNNTLLVVDALIKANKDFDLILIPNAHHGYGEASQYMMRRRWDYFVRYLAGGVPPAQYQMKPYEDVVRAMYANGPSDDEDATADDY